MFSRVAVRGGPRLVASLTTNAAHRTPTPGMKELQNALGEEAAREAAATSAEISVPLKPVKAGRAIRPHELSYSNRVVVPTPYRKPIQVAPTTAKAKSKDIFHRLSVDPLDLATNPLILSNFVTEMGQIRPRTQTQLTVKSQRRLGKAIRRARMMGVLPLLSKLPESSWRFK
ncbi:hypothetical protein MD484_g3976, partial [Candolleomyces efflorescens]